VSQVLPFIDQERSLGIHGERRKEEREKKKEKKAEEEALVAVPLSLCRQRPAGSIVEDGGSPPCRHSTAVVVAVVCRSLSLSLPAEARWPDRRGRGRPPTSSLCCRCGSSGVPLAWPWRRAPPCRTARLLAQRMPSLINVERSWWHSVRS
jgi:hypothetical protein